MADVAWLSSPTHPLASSWAARVVVNGGAAPSDYNVAAISNFCGALDAAGITALMGAVNVFAPDNLIASITPLILNYGNDPWTNNNFASSDLSVDGLRGNGTTTYLNTGVVANVIFPVNTNAGLTLYNTFANKSSARVDIGGGSSASGAVQLFLNAADLTIFDAFSSGGGRVQVASVLPFGFGFTSGNRRSATDASIYCASSSYAFTEIINVATFSSTTAQNNAIYVFAANYLNVASAFSYKRLSFAAIHQALTSAQCQNLYNAVQTLRQALGGGWK